MHQVIVGNVGIVFAGPTFKYAEKAYMDYVELSESEYGHAAGEAVTWFTNGEIVREHPGKPYYDDNTD